MRIECNTCPMQGRRCAECMVPALLELPPLDPSTGHYERLDRDERRAVDVLAATGLMAPAEAVAARAWCEPPVTLRSSG